MKILYLPLKKEWFEMIEAGRKTEEYRAIKPYWIKKLCKNHSKECEYCCMLGMCKCNCFKPVEEYTHVCFRFGYTKRTMTFKIDSISVGFGNPEMGAPDFPVFIIKFSKEDG